MGTQGPAPAAERQRGLITAGVDAIEDSTRAMRRCLDVLNVLGTNLQGLLEVGVDARGPGLTTITRIPSDRHRP